MGIPDGTPKRIFLPIKDNNPFTLLEGQAGTMDVDNGSRAYYRPARPTGSVDPVPDPILLAIDTTVQHSIGEVPVGAIDGVNTVYTVSKPIPNQDTTLIFLNGAFRFPGIDFTVSGNTITFISFAPTGGPMYVIAGVVLTDPSALIPPMIVTDATDIALAGTRSILVDRTATGACSIELSTALLAEAGAELIVFDRGDNAGTFNVTITEEGGGTIAVLAADKAAVKFLIDGTNAHIIGGTF
jgi:hypothetical protein